MRLFTTDDFEGVWPVGVAAMVIAETHEQATELMTEALIKAGLKPHNKFHFTEYNLEKPQAVILQNGDY